jgi:hypothetical protein
MLNDDTITIGFMVAGFVWTIWWNLDWWRCLKFYGIKGPTYPVWVQLPFRVFFALCSLGAAVGLGRLLLQSGHPVRFYAECLLVAGAWFAAIVLMVFAAESIIRKRGRKVIPPQ